MSSSVNGNNISLTRGDTLFLQIGVTKDGEPYTPESTDKIRFALKRFVTDSEPLILKDVDLNTMTLILEADETKQLPTGSYKYDIELTTKEGYVDTFIGPATFKITEEVY